jgi:hypothetical protein
MKTLAAVIVTAAVLAAAAVAGNQAVTPAQVTALGKRVTALEHRTAALQAANAALTTYVNSCLKSYTGVTDYGGSTDGSGYAFNDLTAKTTFNTSALDVTETGQVPDLLLVTAPASCGK